MTKASEIIASMLFPKQKTNKESEIKERFTLRFKRGEDDFDAVMRELEADGEVEREKGRRRVTYLK